MYKLLIVDDEEWIREGLTRTIDWESYGISSVRAAVDAIDAMEKMRVDAPDLVISDVVMPEMKGTELIKWIHEHYPAVKTIMISGFDQFEYARDALRMGAVDYILKPVDEVSLMEAVKRAVRMIRETEKKFSASSGNKEDAGLKHLFYMKLIDLEQPIDAVKSILGEFSGINMTGKIRYSGALWEFNGIQERIMSRIITAMESRLGESFCGDAGYELFPYMDMVVVIVYSENGEQDLSHLLKSQCERLEMGRIWDQYHCCVGGNGVGMEGLREVLARLNLLEENSMQLPKASVLTDYELASIHKNALHQCSLIVPAFIKEFREKGIPWAHAHGGELLDEILDKAPYIGKSELGTILFRFMTQCIAVTEETGRLLNHQIEEDNEVLTWVFSIKSIADIRIKLESFFAFLSDSIYASSENVQKKIIRDALRYIHLHYKEDISVQDLSSYLSISSSYFSQLFSRETGIGFSRYLMNYRVERAKELLSGTSMRVYQIAADVGYSDVKYFLKVFKKVTGVSPQSYRDKGGFN
ncbi:response regulator [Clostridium sp. MCC353]|uniref:response regulator transcription factor n=1 Tax=Clostridium sp. MCC353 TaxID=2592646 RepID=UPI001C0122ED|nr:response regulator [Clostridium sp. MCC353]MBT9776811.1 response regulator [Clostridium sp. MCC353]